MRIIMRFILFTVFLLMYLGLNINGQNIPKPEDNNQKQAQELWEKVIEAKGGRKRLDAITNMALTSHAKVQYSMFKTYDNHVESLFVFPDKEWRLDDNRPSVFGLVMEMYNYKTRMKYHGTFGNTISGLVPFEVADEKYRLDSNLAGLVIYLLETKWWQPVPEAVTSRKKGSRKVDVIQTLFNNGRLDFVIDQKTYLPIQIIGYYQDKTTGKNRQNIYNLSDYVEVDGIMMPSKLSSGGESGVKNLSYQFNVEYDESIFTTPPSFEAGPEAWQSNKNNQMKTQSSPATNKTTTNISDSEINALIKQIADEDADTRGAALDKILEIGQPAVPFLIKQLSDRKKTVVLLTAQALLQIDSNNEDALSALLKILRSGEGMIERGAAFAMASSPKGIRMLADLLEDKKTFIRRSVVFAFDDLTERDLAPDELQAMNYAEPKLKKATNDKDQTVSEMADEVLGQLGRRREQSKK